MTCPPAQGERSRWIERSVRNKLLAMALAPLLVVLPLLMAALLIWGSTAYDQLLIAKVRSDLAVRAATLTRCAPRSEVAPNRWPPPTHCCAPCRRVTPPPCASC